MNPHFLLAYEDELSLIRACIVFKLVGKPLHAKLVSKPLSFKLVSKPLYHIHVLGYTFIWMYSIRPIYTCMLPYMRNVYNF